MKSLNVVVFASAALLGGWSFFGSSEKLWELSVPEAPFSIDREVKDGVPATPEIGKDAIQIGSRKIPACGSVFSVLANGSCLIDIRARFNCHSLSHWDGAEWFDVTVDREARTLRRVCTYPAGKTKDNKPCTFESDIRVLPNGEVELTLFNPGPDPQRGCIGFDVSMPIALWHDQMVSINGSKPFRIPASAHEWSVTPFPKDAKMTAHVYPKGSTFVFYRPDGKTVRFAWRLGENMDGGCIHCGGEKSVGMGFRIHDPAKPAKVVFNLGDTHVPREKSRLVGGIDFRAENDGDAPCWGESKSVLVNGGFESGTRYWKANPILVEDAHTGRYAVKTPTWNDAPIKSVGVVLKPDTWYTVGAWLKALEGKIASVGVQARGTGGYDTFLKSVSLRAENAADWQYASGSFRTKDTISEVVLWIYGGGGKVLFDDLCLVEGSNAVATAVNPWGMEIRTGAEDNLFVPADREDGKIQLLVRGPKGAKASLDISGGDLLGRKTLAKQTAVTIPDAGETLVDLGPDSDFPKGVNGIKVKLTPTSLPTPTPTTYTSLPYTDYLRFMKAKWGDNKQKHRCFQLDPDGRRFVGTRERDPADYDLRLRRDVMLGMGGASYTCTYQGEDYATDEERKVLGAHGFRDFWGGVRTGKNWRSWLNGKPWAWQGTNINSYVSYPDELLQWVENETCAYAQKIPWRTYWSLDSEPAGHYASLRAGRTDEYAKLLTAINRGLKRANPKNEFCPYGTWNMGNGTLEIAQILKELRRIDPETHYKYIEVHSYREFPEDPDVQGDLDNFFSRLASVGYGDIQIKIGEGSYYFPMFRPSKGMYPWTGVGGHDGYSGYVMPGYDLGFGEKIGAALTTRETAIYYKNDKRVFCNCSWNPRWIDNDTPCGWLLANVALLEMLGDATYLDEVRFSQKNSRAMFFDDAHGGTVAFLWRGDSVFDKGQTGPVEAEIDFGDLDVEFYDLYANQVKVRGEGEGKVVLPLSGYPLYIRLPSTRAGKVEAFKRAIAETRVPADLNKLPLSCSLLIRDPSTVIVKAVNTLSRTVEAEVIVNGEKKGRLTLAGLKSNDFTVKLAKPIGADAYADVKIPVEFIYEGKSFKETFETSAVAIGHVAGEKPDWGQIPAVDLANWSCWHAVGVHKSKKDFSGTVKLAWNEKHLWMKFKVKDDLLMSVKDPKDWKTWGSDSDMINLFFDGYANGREKFKRGQKGYDFDDFAFGVFPLSANAAGFIRSRAPDHQLTGGAGYGFVVGPEKNVACAFKSDAQGYEVTLDFPAYYLMPVKLEAGGVSPGFAIAVYDRDQDKYPPRKSVRNYSGPGPDEHPEAWPQLIFVK